MIALWIILGLLALILVLMLIPVGWLSITTERTLPPRENGCSCALPCGPCRKRRSRKKQKKSRRKKPPKSQKGEEIRAAALYGLAAADQ